MGEPIMEGQALSFREAGVHDLGAIVRLLRDDVLGRTREGSDDPLDPAYLRAFERMQAMGDANRIIVATLEGRIVGCVQLLLQPGLSLKGTIRAELEMVRVDSGFRGQGIGEALVAHAEACAREAGAGLVQLTTNSARGDARRFYERLGYQASHVGMKKRL